MLKTEKVWDWKAIPSWLIKIFSKKKIIWMNSLVGLWKHIADVMWHEILSLQSCMMPVSKCLDFLLFVPQKRLSQNKVLVCLLWYCLYSHQPWHTWEQCRLNISTTPDVSCYVSVRSFKLFNQFREVLFESNSWSSQVPIKSPIYRLCWILHFLSHLRHILVLGVYAIKQRNLRWIWNTKYEKPENKMARTKDCSCPEQSL